MHLKVGDMAVYPAHGVGVIEDVEQRTVGDKAYDFFVMRILENGMKIMIPAQNVTEIGLRPLINKKEVAKVYDMFKKPAKLPETTNWNRRHREYMERIKTGSPYDVASVMCELLTMRKEKDLSFGERKLLDTVKVLLVKEMALASGKAEMEVEAEITGFFAAPAKQAASPS
ncbi:CarD family transcriptional regulator [Deltaproteobacteria bacterium OttesenSCG-928-M10]|nr:CarD family transcriptional regulator [Deltaproteobacteria bacterium OttesenSCG-928-M10]